MKSPLRAPALAAALAFAAALLAAPPLAAQKTTIKLATLVPDGSVWHRILKDMGAAWSRDTAGRVTLNIYPGGVAGDEPDMVRKMRIGQLQAATLTVTGLSEIDDSFGVFQVPMFYDSYAELDAVVGKLAPVLRERLDAKGFVLVHWGHAGWVHLFSTKPVRSLDDLKKTKLFVWAGADRMVQWWKANGFQPVALAATDILTGLQTGMIEALPTTPLAALSLQWFRSTPYMLDIGLAPLVGGTVVTKKAWEKLSPEDRAKLLAAGLAAERRLQQEVPAQDAKAVEEVRKRGLQVVQVSDEAAWRKSAETIAASTRGPVVEASIYDLAVRERQAYRAGSKR
jgi:TRAP-type C4-dicarboxylate transport system substrate-binding protein